MKSLVRICRICTKIKTRNSKNLFSSKCSVYLAQIEQITGITFKNEGNLPEDICQNCLTDLKQANAFRMRCIESQIYFESEYQNSICQSTKEKRALSLPKRKKGMSSKISFDDSDVNSQRCRRDVNMKIINGKTNATQAVKDELVISEAHVDDVDSSHLSDDCTLHTDDIVQFETFECDQKSEKDGTYDVSNSDALSTINENKKLKSCDISIKTALKRPRKNIKPKSIADKLLKLEKNKNITDIDKAHDFVCDQCGNYFRNRNHFRTHLNRHIGFKPYDCELCPDKFYTNSELRRHMRHHTGEKPFACRHCDRSFSDYSTRCKHERTHTNERPFSCIHCNKAFTTTYILKNHMLVHTGERRFHCALCNKAFQRQTHLIVHYRSLMHKQNEEKSQNTEVIENPNSEIKV